MSERARGGRGRNDEASRLYIGTAVPRYVKCLQMPSTERTRGAQDRPGLIMLISLRGLGRKLRFTGGAFSMS